MCHIGSEEEGWREVGRLVRRGGVVIYSMRLGDVKFNEAGRVGRVKFYERQ